MHLFIFLGAVAAGTIIGGPVGDRIGRKYVIWCSILGVLPFTLILPYANLFWTGVLTVIIGLVLASAFSAILVYAQELMPGRVGMVSGLFFGLAFGMGGIGAALLGQLADAKGIEFVYKVCAFLPAIGLLTAFLPAVDRGRERGRFGSGSPSTPQAVDIPPVAFRWPAFPFEMRHRFPLLRYFQPQLAAGLRLTVECLGDCGRTSHLTEAQHLDMKIAAVVLYPDHVADTHFARGLGWLPVGLNPAEFTGVRGDRARLEEPGSPEPLVHSHKFRR